MLSADNANRLQVLFKETNTFSEYIRFDDKTKQEYFICRNSSIFFPYSCLSITSNILINQKSKCHVLHILIAFENDRRSLFAC